MSRIRKATAPTTEPSNQLWRQHVAEIGEALRKRIDGDAPTEAFAGVLKPKASAAGRVPDATMQLLIDA